MNTPAIVAFVSAAASVLVTLYGIFERRRAFKSQQEQLNEEASRWRKEFEAERRRQQVLVEKDFHLEQYRYRVAAYADVLKTLGAVSDVTFLRAGPDKYRALHEDRALLESAADALYQHLYSKAGLLMTMKTRNVLHGARRACLSFLASDGGKNDGDNLVDAFFHARRYLRADLELLDDRSPSNLKDLVEQLRAEEKQA